MSDIIKNMDSLTCDSHFYRLLGSQVYRDTGSAMPWHLWVLATTTVRGRVNSAAVGNIRLLTSKDVVQL